VGTSEVQCALSQCRCGAAAVQRYEGAAGVVQHLDAVAMGGGGNRARSGRRHGAPAALPHNHAQQVGARGRCHLRIGCAGQAADLDERRRSLSGGDCQRSGRGRCQRRTGQPGCTLCPRSAGNMLCLLSGCVQAAPGPANGQAVRMAGAHHIPEIRADAAAKFLHCHPFLWPRKKRHVPLAGPYQGEAPLPTHWHGR